MPPSRSRRSLPAVTVVLALPPGAECPAAELGFRASSEPPSRSSRSQTWTEAVERRTTADSLISSAHTPKVPGWQVAPSAAAAAAPPAGSL